MMAGMSARRATHSTVRAWTALLVAGVVTVGVAGCEWRLEQEPVVYPSASQATLERDTAAQREQHVLDALGAGVGGGASASDLASIEAQAAPTHLEALGGIYVAFPSPSPSPAPSPFAGSLDVAVAQARDGALLTATSTTDSNLALLQSSMGLTHAFALWWAQNTDLSLEDAPDAAADPSASATEPGDAEPEVTAVPAVTAQERTLPSNVDLGESFTPDSAAALSPTTLGELAVAHDKARFLYEVVAARSAGAERANALARRDIHAARSDEFAALAGAQDDRQALYEVPPVGVDSAPARATTAREAEFALGATYAALLDGVSSADRGWILNAAFDAYAAGALQAGFTPDKFPVLPGLDSPGR